MTTPDIPDAVYEAAAKAYGARSRELREHGPEPVRAAVDAVWPLARAETLKTAARSLLAEAEAYHEKWIRPANIITSDWDNGYVAGMKRAAHDVANSIERPDGAR